VWLQALWKVLALLAPLTVGGRCAAKQPSGPAGIAADGASHSAGHAEEVGSFQSLAAGIVLAMTHTLALLAVQAVLSGWRPDLSLCSAPKGEALLSHACVRVACFCRGEGDSFTSGYMFFISSIPSLAVR